MEDNIKIFIVQKYKLWLLSYDPWEPVYCSTDLPTAVIVTPSASVQYVQYIKLIKTVSGIFKHER